MTLLVDLDGFSWWLQNISRNMVCFFLGTGWNLVAVPAWSARWPGRALCIAFKGSLNLKAEAKAKTIPLWCEWLWIRRIHYEFPRNRSCDTFEYFESSLRELFEVSTGFNRSGVSPFHLLTTCWAVRGAQFRDQFCRPQGKGCKGGQRLVHLSGQAAEGAPEGIGWGWNGDGMGMEWGWILMNWEVFYHILIYFTHF